MTKFPHATFLEAKDAQAFIDPSDLDHGILRFVEGDTVTHYRLPRSVFVQIGHKILHEDKRQDLQIPPSSPANDPEEF
ncbi:MAG: hypothetical protein ABSF67_22100 [Roseiarcus sp.]